VLIRIIKKLRYLLFTHHSSLKKGFTLIELLIVITIIAILAAVVFVAIDPAKRFTEARNSVRWSEVKSIADAILQYEVDNDGDIPPGIDDTLRMLGTDNSGCNVNCGGTSGSSGSFTDDTQAEFDAGTYIKTQWDKTNNWVELTGEGQADGSGDYTSSVKDTGGNSSWDKISWIPQRPYYKELPNNKGQESGYPRGNADMTGNVLLLHMNEESGTIVDYSGEGNNGTTYGGVTYGAAGKLNTALSFDGEDDYIDCGNGSSLDFDASESYTWEGWFKPGTPTGTYGNIISKLEEGVSGYVIGFKNNKIFIGDHSSEVVHSSELALNEWHHFTITYNNKNVQIYINGIPDGESSSSQDFVDDTTTHLLLGYFVPTNEYFNGTIDEVAIYNRALSAEEILDHYKRGALRLKYHVRSCDDAACDTEQFVGPDGTTGTYYSELDNNSTTTPSFNLTNVSDNQYFQYKAYFETDNSSYTPELKSVTIDYDISGSETTASSCLDLSSYLVDTYLYQIPKDPKYGTDQKTYYAVKETTNGRIKVYACKAELEETISVSR